MDHFSSQNSDFLFKIPGMLGVNNSLEIKPRHLHQAEVKELECVIQKRYFLLLICSLICLCLMHHCPAAKPISGQMSSGSSAKYLYKCALKKKSLGPCTFWVTASSSSLPWGGAIQLFTRNQKTFKKLLRLLS